MKHLTLEEAINKSKKLSKVIKIYNPKYGTIILFPNCEIQLSVFKYVGTCPWKEVKTKWKKYVKKN
jgi:hypothetical protein